MQGLNRLRKSFWIAFLFLGGAVRYAPCEQKEVLLFGNTYTAVRLKIDGRVVDVPPPSGFRGQGLASLPSLSPDGELIAWGLTLPDSDSDTAERPNLFEGRSVLGTYSESEKLWRFYGNFCWNGIGSTAFAQDGNRIAFFATKARSGPHCFTSPDFHEFQIFILDLQTGSIMAVSGTERLMENAAISWSPDGKYLAAQSGFWGSLDQIVVIEVGTGSRRILAEGIDPSWSPSGEWIAYLTDGRDKCVVTHPDGTGMHIVAISRRGFNQGAIWSPDSERLLLNEGFFSDKNDVLELSLSANKVLRKMPHSMFAFGWHTTSHPSPEGLHREH